MHWAAVSPGEARAIHHRGALPKALQTAGGVPIKQNPTLSHVPHQNSDANWQSQLFATNPT